jgi:3,4-dihydroxy 2-butanone 4-phosphate synthase/GTP cyclohydrolase II
MERDQVSFDTVEDAIQAIADGQMVIVVDDEDRENEGDLIMAASKATPEQVGFMIRHTSGILCTPLRKNMAERLNLPPMVSENDAPLRTAFTISVDYKHGMKTGISSEDRAATVRGLANPNSGARDFVRPGHVFPLIAREGGVLVRAGHTEANIDLCDMARLPAVGLLGELMNDDGSVQRLSQLREFAKLHGLKLISIADMIRHRLWREILIECVRRYEVRTEIGAARAHLYRNIADGTHHLALVFGRPDLTKTVAVRMHRANAFDDLFADSGDERGGLVHRALKTLESKGQGIFVYLRTPTDAVVGHDAPSGIELPKVHEESDGNYWREIGIGAQILKDLGVRAIELLTPGETLYKGLDGFGLEIARTEKI